jgi:hypothetical protein
MCSQCLSPLKLWVRTSLRRGVLKLCSCVGGILVNVLTSSVVDHETNIGVVKPDNEVDIWCFSAKHSVIRWVRTSLRRGVLNTTLCDKVCQWLATGRWLSPVSSTNKTDCHEILHRENHCPATSHWQTLSHNFVFSTPGLSWIRTHSDSGDKHQLHR